MLTYFNYFFSLIDYVAKFILQQTNNVLDNTFIKSYTLSLVSYNQLEWSNSLW